MDGRMGWRIALGVLLTVALIAGAAALGWSAYSAGVAQGAALRQAQDGAQAGAQVGPPAGNPVPLYGYGPYGYHRSGLGFGFVSCLVPLVALFLVFGLFRLIFWGGMGWRHHGPWGWGHRGPWGSEEFRNHWRERAEAWHREMHGEGPAEPSGRGSPTA